MRRKEQTTVIDRSYVKLNAVSSLSLSLVLGSKSYNESVIDLSRLEKSRSSSICSGV